PDALKRIAHQAIERKSGARGLRAIIEGVLMDTMFDLPSRTDVKRVIISEKCVNGEEEPRLVLTEGLPKPRRPRNTGSKKNPKSESSVS
ncbi:MAG: ATP-dependent Clp protease ATP-binding subunit ClpX, partial [Eubacteriales bacterium]|nr:ATP-dependent Clp protease ATP-binding subunit ClpX [Eubacteriales bacterium]